MKHSLAVLLLCSSFSWALPANPEYTITVHVSESRMVREGDSSAYREKLGVLVDGKRFQLESVIPTNTLLTLGDYKARIVKDHHPNEYDIWRIYEFQLPDKKTRQFLVVEQSE